MDFGEWTYQADRWVPLYEVVPTNDLEAVKDEMYCQLAAFHRLVGKDPTHIDSHQHVHLREPIRTILLQISRKLAVPLRHCSPKVCYRGNFYGQTAEGTPRPGAISVDGLINILGMLSPGFTELGCHPGLGNDLNSLYRDERVEEMKVLCDPRVRSVVLQSLERAVGTSRSKAGEEATDCTGIRANIDMAKRSPRTKHDA